MTESLGVFADIHAGLLEAASTDYQLLALQSRLVTGPVDVTPHPLAETVPDRLAKQYGLDPDEIEEAYQRCLGKIVEFVYGPKA